MKTSVAIKCLTALLVSSIVWNAYLYHSSTEWKNAFFEEASIVGEIEMILKTSGADTSYENMLAISNRAFKGKAKVVTADKHQMEVNGTDKEAIQLFSAQLLFRGGKFFGTKVNIPNN